MGAKKVPWETHLKTKSMTSTWPFMLDLSASLSYHTMTVGMVATAKWTGSAVQEVAVTLKVDCWDTPPQPKADLVGAKIQKKPKRGS